MCPIRYKWGSIAERVHSGEEFRMSEEIQQTRVTFNCGGVELGNLAVMSGTYGGTERRTRTACLCGPSAAGAGRR